MREGRDILHNLLISTGNLINDAGEELHKMYFEKFFGCKRNGVIGFVNDVEIKCNSSIYGGFTFSLCINYTPQYLFSIARDAEETIYIAIEQLSDYYFLEDLKALELLLEVAD